MRIWLIGCDRAGTNALLQLRKNPSFEVTVSDSTDRPKAVTDGILGRVDHVESVTPMNINSLARRIRPDLILIDQGALQRALGKAGGLAFAESLMDEMAAACEFPLLIL